MISFIAVIFILVLILIGIAWVKLIKEAKKLKIDGPFPLPLIGNAHLFMKSSSEFLKMFGKLTKDYKDVCLIHLFSKRYIFLSHPKYIELILSSTEILTKGNSYIYLLPWLGQGLLTSTGTRWRTHRKFLTPAFHFNILQSFLPVFLKNEKILEEKLKKLADGRPIDLFPIIALAALDNVTESIMGVCVDAQKDDESEYVRAVADVSEIISLRMRNPLIGDKMFNFLPHKRRHDNGLKILHNHTKNVIDKRRQDLKMLNITSLNDNSEFGLKEKKSFLDLLLLHEEDGNKIDDTSIREEVDTFMFEGHDTTTSAIVYTLYCIAQHKDVQEQIYNELKTIFVDDLERDPTYSELHQMKYLEQVIKESLRLYPSVPMIQRLITKDTDIGGLHLTKDTSLVVSIFELQRHPDVYEDPLSFKPERFATGGPTNNPYSWVAFSAGPRNCIGQKFAMMELKVTISGIIKQFEIFPVTKEPKLYSDLILRTPDGVYVKFLPRA